MRQTIPEIGRLIVKKAKNGTKIANNKRIYDPLNKFIKLMRDYSTFKFIFYLQKNS